MKQPSAQPAQAGSIRSAAQDFLEYMATYKRASPATITAYRSDLRRLTEYLESGTMPQEVAALTTRHIQAYAISLSDLAPASVNRALNCVSSCFAFLDRQGLIDGNPVRGVQRPRLPEKLPRAPKLEQVQALVEAAQTPREMSMVLLLCCCGLRRQELLNLELADLSSDLRELTVRHGKGDRERVLPIPEQCAAVLHEHVEGLGHAAGPLFANTVGKPLAKTGFYRIFRRWLRRAGLEEAAITPHSLRHFCGTSLLRGRADIETVRTLLGHRDLRTTSRYLHADDDSRRAAVEQLPNLTVGASVVAEPAAGEVG